MTVKISSIKINPYPDLFKVLKVAGGEAQRLCSERVKTEHLLLSLIKCKEGWGYIAIRNLLGVGDILSPARRIVEGWDLGSVETPLKEYCYSQNALSTLQRAEEIAVAEGRTAPDTGDFLVAVSENKECGAFKVLKELGLSSEKVCQEMSICRSNCVKK